MVREKSLRIKYLWMSIKQNPLYLNTLGVRGRCPRQALMECWRHSPERSEWTVLKARNKSLSINIREKWGPSLRGRGSRDRRFGVGIYFHDKHVPFVWFGCLCPTLDSRLYKAYINFVRKFSHTSACDPSGPGFPLLTKHHPCGTPRKLESCPRV